jgi:hypothetical protein
MLSIQIWEILSKKPFNIHFLLINQNRYLFTFMKRKRFIAPAIFITEISLTIGLRL